MLIVEKIHGLRDHWGGKRKRRSCKYLLWQEHSGHFTIYFQLTKEKWNLDLCRIECSSNFPTMGVTQIYILLANATWCMKNVLTANRRKIQFVKKGPGCCGDPQSSASLIPLCFPSISLGPFGRYLDSSSLNIQGARTIIRWERGQPVNQIEKNTNGSNTPGLPERTDTESHSWACRVSRRWGGSLSVAGWAELFSLSPSLWLCSDLRSAHTHVQHMFPRASGMTG